MKPTVINHPLRQIVLDCENEEAFSMFEREGLETYRHLHDLAYQLQQSVFSLYNFYSAARLEISQRRKHFSQVEAACQPLMPFFNKLMRQHIDASITHEIEFELAPILQVYGQFYDRYMPFFEAMMEKDEAYNQMRELLQQTELELQNFDHKYLPLIIGSNGSVNIDPASLDKDYDDYRSVFSPIWKLEEELVVLRNEVVETLKDFVREVNMLARLLSLLTESCAQNAVLN